MGDMNAADYDNRTALHLACSEGQLDCARFLVNVCGVDRDILDRNGNTALDNAYRGNHKKIIELLTTANGKVKLSTIPVIEDEEEEHQHQPRNGNTSASAVAAKKMKKMS